MKFFLPILLLSSTIIFLNYSCSNKNIISTTDLNSDFPTSEQLEFKNFNEYDIYGMFYRIEDSVLWNFADCDGKEQDFGSCHNLNTGEKISTIISKGKASYELISSPEIQFVGDSIQFYEMRKSIKTFARKDIVENKPINEREFSVIEVPNDIRLWRMCKLPNGSVLATIMPPIITYDPGANNDINKNSLVIFNDSGVKGYQTINYDSFDVEDISSPNDDSGNKKFSADDQIKISYANGDIKAKGNEFAVCSAYDQFMLYIFDINKGTVLKEKRYTKMQLTGSQTVNDMGQKITDMRCTDKYILCLVNGYFSKEDKESRLFRYAIFVFDWDLNPIKRIELPYKERIKYDITDDCKSVYSYYEEEEMVVVKKADINL